MAGTELWEHAQAGWEEGFAEAKKREKEEHKQQMLKRIEEDQKIQMEYATGGVREALSECYEQLSEFPEDLKNEKEQCRKMREEAEQAQAEKKKIKDSQVEHGALANCQLEYMDHQTKAAEAKSELAAMKAELAKLEGS
jgi:chromosome segregation ATPase